MSTKKAAIEICSKIQDTELREFVLSSIEEKGNFIKSVQAFHKLYDCPDDSEIGTTEGVSHMSDERLDLRIDLVREEFEELKEATAFRDEVEMADALSDLIYVIVGFALEMGVDLAETIDEVQSSNLTKLDEDGSVIRREDGKILKGPNFVQPDIKSRLKYR